VNIILRRPLGETGLFFLSVWLLCYSCLGSFALALIIYLGDHMRTISIVRGLAQAIGIAVAMVAGLIALGSAPAMAAQSVPQCSNAVIAGIIAQGTGTSMGSCAIGPTTVNYTCSQSPSAVCTGTVAGCSGNITATSSGITSNTLSCPGSSSKTSSVAMQTVTAAARQASQPGLTAIQSQFTTIRDAIQRGLSRSTGGTPPLGYADQDFDQAPGYPDPKSPRSANPLYTKAPPALPSAPNNGLAVWAQGYGDFEQRWGTVGGLDYGRITRTGGVVGGIDKTFTNVFAPSDALVVGVLSGDVTSGINNNDGSSSRVNGPSAGAYLIWVNGGFSIDSTFKADLLDLDQTTAGVVTPLGLTNYVSALNLYQKFDFKSWWIEPTVGVSDTRTIWNSPGISDGNAFRVQGGARIGTQFMWDKVPVDATLTGLLYDDVSITGGTLATVVGGTLVPTGEGLVFAQGIGRLAFDWSAAVKGLSTYVEGEVRGSSGVFGAAGRLGARYQW
jgi:hypothetical protein